MATFTFYPTEAAYILAESQVSYANSRLYPTATSNVLGGNLSVGQVVYVDYEIPVSIYQQFEGFLGYDTSSLTALWTITGSSFTTSFNYEWVQNQGSSTEELRSYDYGTLELADFIPCANLGNYTLRATYPVTSYMAYGQKAFTNVALSAAVNKGGMTRFVLASSRQRLGQAPIASWERNDWGTWDAALVVYADAPPVPPRVRSGNRIW